MKFLENYLDIVAHALAQHKFSQEPQHLYEPMNYILNIGGKRLRPVMVLMGCDLFHGDLQKALKPALAIEFFHNFSLMHDDIMDKAPIRRGLPTVHTKFDVNTAILSGDALLIKSYEYFSDLEPELYKKCVQLFTQTALLLCEGQQYDMDFENRKEVTFENYIHMITGKTGVLGATAFKIGAIIAGANETDADALYNYGKHIGIAFQIKDDYLDVFGDVSKFGKKQGGDIIENKKTCLYLLALENASSSEKDELLYWYNITSENIDKVYAVEKIFRHAKVDYLALELIKKHNAIAQNYLKEINLPEKNLYPFVELANHLLEREV